MDQDLLLKIPLYFIPFLFSLTFHEYAHGWMALKRGDNTALMLGRLSLNPLVHADPIGTFFFPLIAIIMPGGYFFGWAKPVPVNPRNLKNERVDMFWIAAAGPLSNILLAIIGAFIYAALNEHVENLGRAEVGEGFFGVFIFINLLLAVFNLIPLHPLDGGKILARFLPHNINYLLERNQHITGIVLLVLLFTGGLRYIIYPVFYSANILIYTAESIF